MSQLERGQASFSAEQFLVLLAVFNVTVKHFLPRAESREDALQSALARLGATHLLPVDGIVPDEDLAEAEEVVRDALIGGAPRHLTALAPILVTHPRLNVRGLHLKLESLGLERRLAWVVDNTVSAARTRAARGPRKLARLYRRAATVLETYLRPQPPPETSGEWIVQRLDLLDRTAASAETLQTLQDASSDISKRWNVLSDLQVADFEEALRAAHEAA